MNLHDTERYSKVVVETLNEEEEVENAVNRRYPNRKRQKKYELTFQGKWYKNNTRFMLLNYDDTSGSTSTEEEEIE